MDTVTDKKSHKKVFISYAWGAEEYNEKVTQLVCNLRDAGIDTIYDKFDLTEGADIHTFMEQAVNSKDVDKVLILCDRQYQEKANDRKGGVGKETLIISPEIYNDSNPIGKDKKFIPVIMELDDNGQPYIPTYLKSKVYIDYTHETGESLEKLIRVIYGCPELVAPPLGEMPIYITNTDYNKSFPSYHKLREAINSIYEGKRNSQLLVNSALTAVIKDLEKEKVEYDNNTDTIVNNVIEILRYIRDQLIKLLDAIVVSEYTKELSGEIKKFFENLCDLSERPVALSGISNDMQKDHWKFFLYEVYLYFIAILIEHEKFELIQEFLSGYYVKTLDALVSPVSRYDNLQVFPYKNSVEGLNKLSLQAEWTRKYSGVCGITVDKLIQADFILYLLDRSPCKRKPNLIMYASNYQSLEIFGRATSQRYLKKIMTIFNLSSPQDLKTMAEASEKNLHCREFEWKDANKLMNINRLGTEE